MNGHKRLFRALLWRLLALAGVLASLLAILGCQEQQGPQTPQNRTGAVEFVPKPPPPLPVPASDEILIVSKRKFRLIETASGRVQGSIGQSGSTFFIVENTTGFSTRHRHIEIQGDGCFYRPRQPRAMPIVNATINLDGGEDDLRRMEIICGVWEYAPGILVAQNIFPSELAEMEAAEVGIRVNAAFLLMESWTTPKRLPKQGKWLIRRDGAQGYSFRAELTEEGTPELEIEKGATAEDATQEIASFLEAVNTLVGIMRGFDGFGVKKHPDMAKLIQSKSIEFQGVWTWFDSLSPASQSALIKRFGSVLAKLAVQVFDAPLLEHYLTGLEWTRDILIVDPRWLNDWPHHQEEKPVPFFKNLSRLDVEIRLFWARRGQGVFAYFRDAVQREIKAHQAQH